MRQKKQRNTGPLILSSVLLAIAVALAVWAITRSWRPQDKGPGNRPAAVPQTLAEFAGSEACAKCHAVEYDKWRGSTHGRAGGPPKDVKLIARFDGQPLRLKDAVVTPTLTVSGDPFFAVQTLAGEKFDVRVDAVVGGGHMFGGGTQSFFQNFPDGTMRFLPFDYIRDEKQWFVQLRRDQTWAPITPEVSFETDLANWPPTRVLGSPISMSNCQNCHGSQITIRYDEQNRRYDTHFQTLQIDCESCHGPGKRHIEIVTKPGFERLDDIGMQPLSTLAKDQSLGICFRCHAIKTVLREEPYLPGRRFEDHFSLLLPLFTDDLFTVDGRIKSFGYQSNHLFSDCYLNGSMTCVDCHDPHSQTYRDVFGRKLVGKFDNRQCTGCHASKGSGTEHSHHKQDSPGNLCTSCHMPFLQHKGVGEHFVFARSDHTIPIPRPSFDQQIGIENACQKCHRDKDVAWQEEKVRAWYGEIKPNAPAIARLIRGRESVDPTFAKDFLLLPEAKHPMAQMQGLGTFIRRFVRPGKGLQDQEVIDKLKRFTSLEDPDLKALALMALQVGYDQRPDVVAFLQQQLDSFGTNSTAIKTRWALAADHLGSALSANDDHKSALICLAKSLEILPDEVVTLSHLALAYFKANDAERAIATLRKAISIKPSTANLYFQLAQLQMQLQQIPEAIESLQQGLRYAPEDRTAKFLLEKLRAL